MVDKWCCPPEDGVISPFWGLFIYLFMFLGGNWCLLSRAVHRSGRVGFGPNPDSTHQRRMEGRRNPKPTAVKIGRFGFGWWLALVKSGRLPKLKKALKSEKKSCQNLEFSSESGKFCRKLENIAGNWKKLVRNWISFNEICIFFG